MNCLNYAITQMLWADPLLQETLCPFEFAGETKPAVFMIAPTPEDDDDANLPFPYIVSEGSVHDVEDDTKDLVGHDIHRDVRCYDLFSGDSTTVNQIAMRIKDIFHRQEARLGWYIMQSSEPWFTVTQCWADGPRAVAEEVDEYVLGRIVSLIIRLTRIPSTMPYPI